MPWNDWQFWLVTVIAAFAFWVVLKRFIPKRRNRRNDADSAKPTATSEHRVRLTVDKKRV